MCNSVSVCGGTPARYHSRSFLVDVGNDQSPPRHHAHFGAARGHRRQKERERFRKKLGHLRKGPTKGVHAKKATKQVEKLVYRDKWKPSKMPALFSHKPIRKKGIGLPNSHFRSDHVQGTTFGQSRLTRSPRDLHKTVWSESKELHVGRQRN